MRPEHTAIYHELGIPEEELGNKFTERWLVPELREKILQDHDFLRFVGRTLKLIGQGFPKSDPEYDIPLWEDRLSLFDLYDLSRESIESARFEGIWEKIHKNINKDLLYFPKGSVIELREYDFLVTTPLAKSKEHVQEAEDAIRLFKETGEIDHYYREIWPFPKNLRVGSKFFYVDNRAIRGFAVLTNIDIEKVTVNMDVNTWRWINPIPCDYGKIKPPQRYAYAIGHQYLDGLDRIQVIGDWLDTAP